MKNGVDDQLRGIQTMVLATLCFATMFACVKWIGGRLPSPEVAFFRSFIGLALLTPVMLKRNISLLGTQRRMLFARSVLGLTSLILNFYAAAHLKLSDTSVLLKTSVIFTALLSVLVLKERLTLRLGAYTALAFAGSALIVKPSFDFINVPGLAGLTSGALIGVIGISIRRLHATENSSTIVFNLFLYTSIITPLLFASWFVVPTVPEVATLIVLSIAGLSGQILFTQSLKYCPASVVYPYSFFELLFSLALGALCWGELPDALSLVGATLIVVAGLGILGVHVDRLLRRSS